MRYWQNPAPEDPEHFQEQVRTVCSLYQPELSRLIFTRILRWASRQRSERFGPSGLQIAQFDGPISSFWRRNRIESPLRLWPIAFESDHQNFEL
jgi:hypothetical protein